MYMFCFVLFVCLFVCVCVCGVCVGVYVGVLFFHINLPGNKQKRCSSINTSRREGTKRVRNDGRIVVTLAVKTMVFKQINDQSFIMRVNK